MADAGFEHPRLTAIYDGLGPDRSDLDAYVAIVEELGARAVLDVGCGTGTFALLLAARGGRVTGNVAQAVVDPAEWEQTLRGVHAAVRPGGHLVFETRDPARRQWEEWNRAASLRTTVVPGVGAVQSWYDVVDVDVPLVTFRSTYVFASDGVVLTSMSTLRFRERDEVEAQLHACGYVVDDVRDAPDRPGRELVLVARRRA